MALMREPEAAVAIVVAREPEEAVLLIRRAEREGDAWSGHWSLPGGRRDSEDADPLQTALRELEEECGIRLDRKQMTAALPLATARRRADSYLLVAPFVFCVKNRFPTILDSNEAVEAFWIPVEVLRDMRHHALRPVPGRPSATLFPAIELNRVPLWGFTYRLLADWLGLTPGAEAGREAARHVLEFLLARGLRLRHAWEGRLAAVAGAIPVGEVVRHYSAPRHFLPAIHCLDVREDRVGIFDPDFEEYVITAG